jgi:hypothetical protein
MNIPYLRTKTSFLVSKCFIAVLDCLCKRFGVLSNVVVNTASGWPPRDCPERVREKEESLSAQMQRCLAPAVPWYGTEKYRSTRNAAATIPSLLSLAAVQRLYKFPPPPAILSPAIVSR